MSTPTSTPSTDPTPITFESGYRRLQEIAERVGSEEVPVHEMCDLFAEGRGLDQALTGYLSEQKMRVEAIERGEGIQAFKIVAPAADPAQAAPPAAPSDFVPPASTPRAAPADDDIPF
jgi:exonuclease VII small subunit